MSDVAVTVQDGLTVVTLKRAPVNALTAPFLHELADAADTLAANPPAAVVLRGGEKAFSAGVDLKIARTLDAAGWDALNAALDRAFAAWYALPCPVVAALHGPAIAGGLILALCADWRVAAPGADISLAEVEVGIRYPPVALAVVRSELSGPAARRLALGGRKVDATTGVRLGALDEIALLEHVDSRAREHAADLATHDPATYADTKRRLRAA